MGGNCGKDKPSKNQWNSFVKITSYHPIMDTYAGATKANAVGVGVLSFAGSCGATDLDLMSEREDTNIPLEKCQEWSSNTPDCCAIVYSHFGGKCARRSNCDAFYFCKDESAKEWNTFVKFDAVVTYDAHVNGTASASIGGGTGSSMEQEKEEKDEDEEEEARGKKSKKKKFKDPLRPD